FVVLGCASLPACYGWSKEAHMLVSTHRLECGIARRLPETAQMVIDVMAPGGLFDKGLAVPPGIRAIQKVRLLHAVIRRLYAMGHQLKTTKADSFERIQATSKENRWAAIISHGAHSPFYADKVQAGQPPVLINQEQLVATMLTFSYIMIRSYRRLGIQLTDNDAQAYLHMWSVVGSMLGIDRRVLLHAKTQADAERMYGCLMARNTDASDDGRVLNTTLLKYMQRNMATMPPLRWAGLDRFPRRIMSELLDSSTAKALGLRLGRWERAWTSPYWWGLRATSYLCNFASTRWLSDRLFSFLSKRMWRWREEQDGSPVGPYVPPHLLRRSS
ncbi:MAG: oxygenase MpaB family protein, partial [Myxococcota bacterium]